MSNYKKWLSELKVGDKVSVPFKFSKGETIAKIVYIGSKWIKTNFYGDFYKNTGYSKTEHTKIWKDKEQHDFYESQEEEIRKMREEKRDSQNPLNYLGSP